MWLSAVALVAFGVVVGHVSSVDKTVAYEVDLEGKPHKHKTSIMEAVNSVGYYLDFGLVDAMLVTKSAETKTLKMSGIVASLDDKVTIMPVDDVCGQFQTALENISRLLKEADMKTSDIVKGHVFTTDFDGLIECWDDVFVTWMDGHEPACTAVQVVRLYDPDAKIEVEFEAVKG